jgi:hypothetical protein
MKPLSLFGYAAFVAAILLALFSIDDGAGEQSATMAPDLHFHR